MPADDIFVPGFTEAPPTQTRGTRLSFIYGQPGSFEPVSLLDLMKTVGPGAVTNRFEIGREPAAAPPRPVTPFKPRFTPATRREQEEQFLNLTTRIIGILDRAPGEGLDLDAFDLALTDLRNSMLGPRVKVQVFRLARERAARLPKAPVPQQSQVPSDIPVRSHGASVVVGQSKRPQQDPKVPSALRVQEPSESKRSESHTERTGLAIRPLSFEDAYGRLVGELDHGLFFRRFANSTSSWAAIQQHPARDAERAALEQHAQNFWFAFNYAGGVGDRRLRRHAVRDFGVILGHYAIRFKDAGLPEAARLYAALSPALRQDLVQSVKGGMAEGLKAPFSGLFDQKANPFASDTPSEALAALQKRHSASIHHDPNLRRNSVHSLGTKPESEVNHAKQRLADVQSEELRTRRAKTLSQNRAKSDQQLREFTKRLKKSRFVEREVSEVTVKVIVKGQDGAKRYIYTRLDKVIILTNGKLKPFELKSSATAPLTKNQSLAFPEIERNGAQIVGKRVKLLGDIDRLPAGRVPVIRPKKQ